ncbi:UNVERIFIED_CONTAM: hypothetical protein HDU68_003726 [Siphonaria sp. JEL0065]|nr:hypothetical protein HDU68_003726 [Siphonaria sp. JEL0065]
MTNLKQGAKQLPTVDFDGTYVDLKATLWDLAKTHIKGLGKVEGEVISVDWTEQTEDSISDFVVILKSSRSYTFGDVVSPLLSINKDLGNLVPRRPRTSSGNTATVADLPVNAVIYVYSRHVSKAADYERIVALITGGPTTQDRSGAPNQQRFNDAVQRLRGIHTHLRGEDMIWNDWAGTLLGNPETLDAEIHYPPPADITLLFERQNRTEQQLVQVRKSLVTDVMNQLGHMERNLKAHKRACRSVLDGISPVETAAAAAEFSQIQNEQDLEHQEDSDLEGRGSGQRQQEEEEEEEEEEEPEESLKRRQPQIRLQDNDGHDNEDWSDALDNLSQ